MNKTIIPLLIILLLLAGLPASSAQAHNGPPRLDLGAERALSGTALEVRGVNIAPEQPVMRDRYKAQLGKLGCHNIKI